MRAKLAKPFGIGHERPALVPEDGEAQVEKLIMLLDRTAVLFVGIAVGAVIGLAFLGSGETGEAVASAPPPVVLADESTTSEAVPGECAVQFNRSLTNALAAGEPVHIGVFGDSFGDGLWAALYRGFRGDENFVVHQFARQSTGFTRYRSLNIFDDMTERLDEQPVDIAVLSFGANDTQGIYTGNSGAAFMSEEWQGIVGERIDAIVQLLRDRGAIVYWVGMPKMRRETFDAQIQQQNAFYAARMRQLGVPFIDTVSLSVDEAGQYAAYLPHPETGERTLARANDGIHMTGQGYGFLTRGLEQRIRGYVDSARAEAMRERDRRNAANDDDAAGQADG
ncbi:MAG: GDSL-type esterase/lipase family protein [Pseudomonadota bacterium]